MASMKLKEQPDDFQVEELTDVAPTGSGPFALYSLQKQGWTTPDALQAIRRRWRIDRRRMSYGGLKDRHADTLQYLTIFRGPQRNLTHQRISVRYLGQIGEPYSSDQIRANRFRIVLREVLPEQRPAAESALEEIRADGVPNYFDDQRFGSVAADQQFVARLMIQERYEQALRQALAAAYAYDRAAEKREKAILRKHWGDWSACKNLLSRSHARSIVDYLVHHPTDFRGALARLRPELRGLYLSAYQSYLWNQILAALLLERCRPEQLVLIHLRLGNLPMHRRLAESQHRDVAALTLPLPTARTKLDPDDARVKAIHSVLSEEGLEWQDLKLKGFREMFFSKGERPALCLPTNLQYAFEDDDRHTARQKLVLSFELPRGSYATLIVKRVQTGGVPEARENAPLP
jgi:tRNA pseudouridine13 synthase